VHRKEVYEAIQRENRRASQLHPKDTRDLPDPGKEPGRSNS
jgi:sRNA-binding carbon storage regulator CsrA